MRSILTESLTRILPGNLAITAILAVIGLVLPESPAMGIAITSGLIFVVLGSTWAFLLLTYLPEYLSLKSEDILKVRVKWAIMTQPSIEGAGYDTCTGRITTLPPLPPPDPPTSSY